MCFKWEIKTLNLCYISLKKSAKLLLWRAQAASESLTPKRSNMLTKKVGSVPRIALKPLEMIVPKWTLHNMKNIMENTDYVLMRLYSISGVSLIRGFFICEIIEKYRICFLLAHNHHLHWIFEEAWMVWVI